MKDDCAVRPQSRPLRSVGDIVDEYIRERRAHLHDRLDYFRKQQCLESTIRKAALAEGAGGKLPHQPRCDAAMDFRPGRQ